MTLKSWSLLFGIAFIIIGILGFIPAITPDNLLFGLFMVDTIHNVIHLVSGALALVVAYNLNYATLYFRIFGVVYAVVAIAGFFTNDLLIIHVNLADNFLHLVIAALSLYLGFLRNRLKSAP